MILLSPAQPLPSIAENIIMLSVPTGQVEGIAIDLLKEEEYNLFYKYY